MELLTTKFEKLEVKSEVRYMGKGIVQYGKVLCLDSMCRLVARDNEEEKAVIKLIMTSDKTAGDMVEELNTRGITRRGKGWTVAMIRYIRMTGNVPV